MSGSPRILRLFAGAIQKHIDDDGAWSSGIGKAPVDRPISVSYRGLAGDEQADLEHHGGPDKAVLAYASSHYEAWAADAEVGRLALGMFGENLLVEGLDESMVQIGERWRVGSALLEVSQSRPPCWKLNRHSGKPRLVDRIVATGRTGWYLRVLEEGELSAGEPIQREPAAAEAETILEVFTRLGRPSHLL